MNCIHCGNDFCTCSRESAWNQTQGTLLAWFTIAALCAIFIVFVAFGASSYKILSAPKLFDQQTGKLKFAGIEWLYLSPLCVGASACMIAFALSLFFGVAATERERTSVEAASTFLIIPTAVFVLGMLLTLFTFLGKNWKQVVETVKDRSFFAADRKWTSIGVMAITLITILPVPLVAVDVALMRGRVAYNSYVARRELADAERPQFDQWVGRYKMYTRKDPTIAIIKKAVSGDALQFGVQSADTSKPGRKLNDDECLLVPAKSNFPSYYRLENCIVGGKPSPLAAVSFKLEGGATRMHFFYRDDSNGTVLGDDLQKIE